MRLTAMYDDIQVTVPESAYSLEGFRDWSSSNSFPDQGRISYIRQEVFVDMSPERFSSHNQVKTEVNRVVGNLVVDLDLGKFCQDGLWITNDAADLSNEPDGTFISWEAIESKRVELVHLGDDSDGIELRGSPDWVLEVISNSSERKDTIELPIAYFAARVREYWLIDARGEEVAFRILAAKPGGFVDVESGQDGWLVSPLFGHSFLLDRTVDRLVLQRPIKKLLRKSKKWL